MIVITDQGSSGAPPEAFAYVRDRGPVARTVLRLTRWLRAVNAERYMAAGERHLDIGCGDGYFLRRSKCRERIGLDRLLGDDVSTRLDFPDQHFDYVTMLAVIEHLERPEALVAEIARVLKPGGSFIATTPKRAAEALIRLYASDVEEQHERYFDLAAMRELAGDRFDIVGHGTFILGLNQVFCLRRRDGAE